MRKQKEHISSKTTSLNTSLYTSKKWRRLQKGYFYLIQTVERGHKLIGCMGSRNYMSQNTPSRFLLSKIFLFIFLRKSDKEAVIYFAHPVIHQKVILDRNEAPNSGHGFCTKPFKHWPSIQHSYNKTFLYLLLIKFTNRVFDSLWKERRLVGQAGQDQGDEQHGVIHVEGGISEHIHTGRLKGKTKKHFKSFLPFQTNLICFFLLCFRTDCPFVIDEIWSVYPVCSISCI